MKRSLILIIGLSFLASLVYSLVYRIHPAVDAKAYDAIAQNIVAGHGFREATSGDITFDRSIQRAGPAYEYFLAGVYAVFGHEYVAVWVVQALLHALGAWLIYLTARRLFPEGGEQIGLIAAAVFGFHPDLIEISAMLMTETFYLFFTTLIMYLFVRVYEEKDSWKLTTGLSLALAIGLLSRPPLFLFIPIIAWLYFKRKSYTQLIFFLAVIVLTMAPWTIRNYHIYNQFIPTTLIGEYNLWVGNTTIADGGQLSQGFNPFDRYVGQHGYVTAHQAATTAFTEFLYEHPGRFIELTIIRCIRYVSLIRPMGFWFYQTGLPQAIFVILSALATAFLFIMGGTGMIKLWSKRTSKYYYFIVLALSAPLPLLPTVVQSRYRFQIYPWLALFAGYAIVSWFKKNRSWREHAFVLSATTIVAVTLIDILMNSGKIIERIRMLF